MFHIIAVKQTYRHIRCTAVNNGVFLSQQVADMTLFKVENDENPDISTKN